METVNKFGRIVHRSKWGFHPVSYSVFRKLKTLHRLYWEAVRDNANFGRWERKLPKNRKGRPPVPNVDILNSKILEAYQDARMPVLADEVCSPVMSESQVDSLLGVGKIAV